MRKRTFKSKRTRSWCVKMSDLSNDTKKHTTKSRETIPLNPEHGVRHRSTGWRYRKSCVLWTPSPLFFVCCKTGVGQGPGSGPGLGPGWKFVLRSGPTSQDAETPSHSGFHPPHLLYNRRGLTRSNSEFRRPEMWALGSEMLPFCRYQSWRLSASV
jgi:hypothetical protein